MKKLLKIRNIIWGSSLWIEFWFWALLMLVIPKGKIRNWMDHRSIFVGTSAINLMTDGKFPIY